MFESIAATYHLQHALQGNSPASKVFPQPSPIRVAGNKIEQK